MTIWWNDSSISSEDKVWIKGSIRSSLDKEIRLWISANYPMNTYGAISMVIEIALTRFLAGEKGVHTHKFT